MSDDDDEIPGSQVGQFDETVYRDIKAEKRRQYLGLAKDDGPIPITMDAVARHLREYGILDEVKVKHPAYKFMKATLLRFPGGCRIVVSYDEVARATYVLRESGFNRTVQHKADNKYGARYLEQILPTK